jgi:hypothetical protein
MDSVEKFSNIVVARLTQEVSNQIVQIAGSAFGSLALLGAW